MAQSHRSDPRILGRRSLERNHKVLARLLRPGLSVLDVGCGTGAITVGVAKAVGPNGYAIGVDRDETLLELGRREHSVCSNLRLESGDATSLNYREQFDIVTAARTLQWISEPDLALSKMRDAAKKGGVLVILDYSHARNEWEPDAPPEFRDFYRAFLVWREANRWDNELADHLPQMFQAAGLTVVQCQPQNEIVERGEPDFNERSALWLEVIESVGGQVSKAGFCTETQLQRARERYCAWIKTQLVRQHLAMSAVTGIAAG